MPSDYAFLKGKVAKRAGLEAAWMVRYVELDRWYSTTHPCELLCLVEDPNK